MPRPQTPPTAPMGQPNLAAVLSTPLPNISSPKPENPDTSPANIRRLMEEKEELAKTSAPPAIKPQQGDPYREAVE